MALSANEKTTLRERQPITARLRSFSLKPCLSQESGFGSVAASNAPYLMRAMPYVAFLFLLTFADPFENFLIQHLQVQASSETYCLSSDYLLMKMMDSN